MAELIANQSPCWFWEWRVEGVVSIKGCLEKTSSGCIQVFGGYYLCSEAHQVGKENQTVSPLRNV